MEDREQKHRVGSNHQLRRYPILDSKPVLRFMDWLISRVTDLDYWLKHHVSGATPKPDPDDTQEIPMRYGDKSKEG